MVWSGKVGISEHFGGRHGPGVVLEGNVLVPRSSTWTVTGGNGHPDARVEVEIRGGRPEVVEIWIGAKPQGRGVKSSDMTVFNIDNLLANILTEVGVQLVPNPEEPGTFMSRSPKTEDETWAVNGAVRSARSSSRSPVSREELEAVAAAYKANADGAPVKSVGARFGYSARTAARRVEQARAAGLLPPTSPGKVTS